MASVDWMKLQSGGMRKLAGHYQQELREKLNHSNHHINPEMTKHNFSIGAKDFYEACDKVNARIQEVDKEHPPKRIKKDRVVACSLYVPCPPEICDKGIEASSDFMRKVYAAMEDYFGKENVGGGFVHLDEQHEYIDANTKEKRMSLHHMNVFLPAFVDEDIKTKKGIEHMTGINGKNFVSRKHMKEVNKIMEDICHEYGIEWHTGQGKNHETVETLKAKSAEAEREIAEQKLSEIQTAIQHNRKIGTKEIAEIKKVREDVASEKAELEKVREDVATEKSELEKVKEDIVVAKSELKDLKDDITKAKEIRSRETMSVLQRIRFYLDHYLDVTLNDRSFLHKFINMFESWDKRERLKGQVWKDEQKETNTVVKKEKDEVER